MCNNKNINCVIVIPVYRVPTMMEQCSFKQCLQVLNKYDITIVTNSEVDMTKFNDISQMCGKSFSIELFDKEYFEGIKGYNDLCLSKAFYQRFADRYVYMLIYQLDAWVFRDELQDWCNKGYDYVGPPFFVTTDGVKHFIKKFRNVGNGGLSLRKIKYCLDILNLPKHLPYITIKGLFSQFLVIRKYSKESFFKKLIDFGKFIGKCLGICNTLSHLIISKNEDLIFSEFSSVSYYLHPKMPTPLQATNFAWELFPSYLYNKNNGRLPFGCHAFEKYEYLDFWSIYIPKEINLPNFMKVNPTFPFYASFLDCYGDKINIEYPMLKDIVLQSTETIPQNGGLTSNDSPYMESPIMGQNNSFVLYRNSDLCVKMGLTIDEQYSLIAHELGHIIFKLKGLSGSLLVEECFADEVAAKIVGKGFILSALKRIREYLNTNPVVPNQLAFLASNQDSTTSQIMDARISTIEKNP